MKIKKRFVEGNWLDEQEQLDFLIEKVFQLQEKLKEFHPSWTKAYKKEKELIKKAFEDVIKR